MRSFSFAQLSGSRVGSRLQAFEFTRPYGFAQLTPSPMGSHVRVGNSVTRLSDSRVGSRLLAFARPYGLAQPANSRGSRGGQRARVWTAGFTPLLSFWARVGASVLLSLRTRVRGSSLHASARPYRLAQRTSPTGSRLVSGDARLSGSRVGQQAP